MLRQVAGQGGGCVMMSIFTIPRPANRECFQLISMGRPRLLLQV